MRTCGSVAEVIALPPSDEFGSLSTPFRMLELLRLPFHLTNTLSGDPLPGSYLGGRPPPEPFSTTPLGRFVALALKPIGSVLDRFVVARLEELLAAASRLFATAKIAASLALAPPVTSAQRILA